MSRRASRIALLLLAMIVAGSALLPLAQADHTYSHRYLVFGRVVDAEGAPVEGYKVDLGVENFKAEGACDPQPNTETDAWGRTETRVLTNAHGEFSYCVHAHGMSRALPGTGTLRVVSPGGEEAKVVTFDFDPYYRMSYVTIQLDDVVDAEHRTDAFDSNYTVAGRVWTDTGERFEDGVRVYGDTVEFALVRITLTYNGGKTSTVETRTNGYGDFAVRVPVEERVQTGTVKVEADNRTFSYDADPVFGLSSQKLTVEPESTGIGRKLLVFGGGVLIAAAVIGGGVWGLKAAAAKREEASIRAQSTRKRANK